MSTAMNKRCDSCWNLKAEATYTGEGVISSITVDLCDPCAEKAGLKTPESLEDLLARLSK